MHHVTEELGVTFAMHSLNVSFAPATGSVVIDPATIRSLELIQNGEAHKSKQCLFGLLNETLTPMGARRLRTFILQPSTDEEKINARLDAVEELTLNEHVLFAVRKALKDSVDAEKVLTDVSLSS
jgi:DNA mismatch repair protein MSH4